MTIAELFDHFLNIAEENDWRQFHTPKNLASAISVEAGELLEHFQWLSDGDFPADIEAAGDEIADIFMYLVALCDRLDLDLEQLIQKKTAANEARFTGVDE